MTPDKTIDLVKRIRRSERDAFDALCRECTPSLLSYAGMLLKDEWAEDAVQDVLYEVWRRRETLSEDGNIRGYLLRAVYNRSLNYLRKGSNTVRLLSPARAEIFRQTQALMSPDNNPVIQAVFASEKRQVIDSAIQSLPPRQQEVFRLSFYGNLTNTQIAQRLGIDVRTVENNKSLALKELRLKVSSAE